ncbi:MAG: hypothetical protein V7K25_09140 [Nostoc sp.]|uniref:hypothetical protein n=1 Tax=Nostoc sp. TaxID=1180 RepID=UPI002FF6CCFB
MSKKSLPATQKQNKARLGDQIRSIADRLKQETDVQIKATSKILGAVDILKQQFKTLRDAKAHFNLKVSS